MEVGWYLRFAKTDRVEVQVSLKGEAQVSHEQHIFKDWSFEFQNHGDHVLAIMTRMKPLYEDKEEA